MFKPWPIFLLLLRGPVAGNATSFAEAAARYRVPSPLLQAISRVESSGDPGAIHRNADGSHNIGHMQINSRWLPVLQQHGIGGRALLEPCAQYMCRRLDSGPEPSFPEMRSDPLDAGLAGRPNDPSGTVHRQYAILT